MPLFEYHCLNCKSDFEQITAHGADDQGKCPKCKAKNTQKLISRFAIKGRGDQRESTFHGCHDHYTGVSGDGVPSYASAHADAHAGHGHDDHGGHDHHDHSHSHSHDAHPFLPKKSDAT